MTSEVHVVAFAEMGESRFNAPWEARIFSIVNELQASGCISRQRWMEIFAAERARHSHDGNSEERSYFHAWLAACEGLLIETGHITPEELAAFRDDTLAAWPDHGHHAHYEPIAVSQARR